MSIHNFPKYPYNDCDTHEIVFRRVKDWVRKHNMRNALSQESPRQCITKQRR